uniref:Fibronectin type-III domain-containing protein n=1 Tax=Lepisosteus oculatus TaxID=7918 RepID=W5NCU0_LEPOC
MNGAAEVGELQGSPELELGSGLIKDAPSLFCSSSQVILVQVNPGETFTIRTEDGHIQCIPGPAHVPMVSPNGSMPPIFLPPGYMSQVVEENGMRKVVVLPHSAEFHHSMAHPHPHVPPYLPPHPALLHHHHVYPPVPATGELPPHFLPQHPPPQIYSDQEAAAHGRGGTGLSRDDRAAKTQESLRKRLKDRPLCAKAGGSPPPLPHNGCGKGHAGAPAPCNPKSAARPRATPPAEGDSTAGAVSEAEVKGLVEQLSSVAKPVVSDPPARSAMLSWSSPLGPRDSDSEAPSAHSLSYELALSHAGRSADYSPIYVAEAVEASITCFERLNHYLGALQLLGTPVLGLEGSVCLFRLCVGSKSSAFPSLPGKRKNRYSAYLPLLFQAPSDNGSKIAGYLLEYDEGNQSAFKEVYFGHMKQFKVIRLTPSTKYAFRLAAKNDIGLSAFSEVLTCCTSGCVPSPPAPPRLAGAGVSWLALEWSTPSGLSGEESLTYTLEMEEEGSGYGFKPKHNGEELSCTLKNLRRSTSYRFRLFAANVEGRSQPSAPVEFSTSPDKPGPPGRPTVKGRVHAHRVHTVWDAPRDSGGSEVTKYVLEISENLNGNPWEMVYSGLAREHVCDRLSPGSWYRLRVYCLGAGGQSQASDVLTVQTAAVPPGPCQPLCLVGRPKPREIPLRWGPPLQDGGAPVSQFAVEMADSAQGPRQQLYEGPETECTASDLRPGRTYCFWVKAANQAGWGPLSEMWETPTAPGAPEQCDAPQLTVRTATCVLAAWERPGCNGAEISEFRLECGAAQGSLQLAYCGPALSYELRGLTPATTYFCRVQVGLGTCFHTHASLAVSESIICSILYVHLSKGPMCCLCSICCVSIFLVQLSPVVLNVQQLTNFLRCTSTISPAERAVKTPILLQIELLLYRVASPGAAGIIDLQRIGTHGCCSIQISKQLKLRVIDETSRTSDLNIPSLSVHTFSVCLHKFVCIYSGPCHTYKLQRLGEATVYHFRIQAQSEAGVGPLSPVYSFRTAKSPPAQLRAPKVQHLDGSLCEVTWEGLPPMRGDPIVYALQLTRGREAEQLYKGPDSSFLWRGAAAGGEYRLRVCAARRCQDSGEPLELWGQYSPGTLFSCPEPAGVPPGRPATAAGRGPPARGAPLSDEQFALLLLLGFAVVAVLFAVVIQYFVIK